MSKVLIIGGGAAGMMAGGFAARNHHEVHILEKNEKLGKKVFITGKGRCNLTNSAPIMDLIGKTPGNGKFLYSAYEAFSNEDLLELLHGYGLVTKVERGGRVFPASDDAQEVRHLFMRLLKEKKPIMNMAKKAMNRVIISSFGILIFLRRM